MTLANKVALVTGAASGMGAATARLLADKGARVMLVDLNGALLQRVAGTLDNVGTAVGDVSDSVFCDAAVGETVARFGRIDILINAAGIIHRADAAGTSDDAWQRVMNVNVNGVFYMSRAALLHMKRQGSGSIVNFGSIWGDVGAAGVVAYCASKGAVHQITRAMALDHALDNIRINAVCPGEVDTPMLRSGRERPPSAQDMQRLADSVPMKRLADPIEIARAVCFIASDDASYMTGAMIPVDAGFTAR